MPTLNQIALLRVCLMNIHEISSNAEKFMGMPIEGELEIFDR